MGGVLTIYKLGLFEDVVMRIMFELKTEEIGGKGCIMCSFIIHTACHILGVSKNSGKMGEECGMHGSEGDLEQIFDWETWRKESIQKVCVNMGDKGKGVP
jgi:hypothetical protein